MQKEEKHRLSAKEIESIQLELLLKLLKGEITEGRLLRILRKQVLDYSQTEFAKMVGVSRKTISDFETNSGSKTLQTVNKLFKPFGLRTGIVPKQPEQIEKLTRKLNVE
ncbi:hypothetical protein ACH42_15075 [Endozoicomonas sp. (ex Bugula neritina AB1)]|nr:hypothetical protein ACH42_15075 [Endozoicomonas sp. (ex Bugula neritina AB1)]